MRNCLLGFVIFLSLAETLPVHSAEAKPTKPNILFLFADDMRADSVGALGNPEVKTPNLDGLVKRGLSFQNAYCFGGNSGAVCLPSRNMLLSGNSFFRWRGTGPKGQATNRPQAPADGLNFPVSMKEAGYFTYHHGKKGNTAQQIQAKFDVDKYVANDQAERNSGEPGKEIVDAALNFLQERQDAKPFFMYLAFGNPHDPRVAAKKYLEQYDPAKLSLPKNYLPIHPFDNGEMTIRDEKLLPWPRTEAAVRNVLHEYYATITGLDHHIGRLLTYLQEKKMLENTLVIFSADQGIAVGSHGLLGKQNLYDAGMKVPLVFAGPGVSPGQTEALVYLFDIYPTVADWVGAKVPNPLDGKSFKAIVTGKAKVARTEMMGAYLDKQRSFRDEKWKLIRYPQVDVTQLFDLQQDPHEMKNLAGLPEHKARVADMLKRLQAQQKEYGDVQPLTVENPKPAQWTPPKK